MRGKITGCPTANDWWVRMMPMFGVFRGFLPHEGYVNPEMAALRSAEACAANAISS